MPTIAETATLSLTGFDRDKGKYRQVSLDSKTEHKVALVHAALRAFALTHNFDEMEEFGHPGFVGHASVRSICRELFNLSDDDRLDQLAKQVADSAKKTSLMRCVDSGTRFEGQLPIWWVASDYASVAGHQPLHDLEAAVAPAPAKKAPAPKAPASAEEPKKGRSGGRVKGSRNRTRIELLSLAERTLKDLGRPALVQELFELANFPVGLGSVRDAYNELLAERRVYRRDLTDEDRAILKRAGGPKNLRPDTSVFAHSTFAPLVDGEREIGLLGWSLPPVDGSPEPKPTAMERVAAGIENAHDVGKQIGKAIRDKSEPEPEPEDDVDAAIAALERKAKVPKDSGEVAELQARVAELEATLAKVTTQRDRLLAVVKTMGDDE